MSNTYFRFRQFAIHQDKTAMKVTTDSCLFGAWCASQIAHLKKENAELLDIGTGTGLLSLMTRQLNPLSIDAVELDQQAFEQARENISSSPWKEINVIQSDILDFHPTKKYDYIISNPPFYENELKSPVAGKNLAHHSAELTIGQLTVCLKNLLKEDGVFFLLLPFKRKNEIEKIFSENGLFISQRIQVKATPEHPPTRLMVSGSFVQQKSITHEMNIRTGDGNYSKEFEDLLRGYYLKITE